MEDRFAMAADCEFKIQAPTPADTVNSKFKLRPLQTEGEHKREWKALLPIFESHVHSARFLVSSTS